MLTPRTGPWIDCEWQTCRSVRVIFLVSRNRQQLWEAVRADNTRCKGPNDTRSLPEWLSTKIWYTHRNLRVVQILARQFRAYLHRCKLEDIQSAHSYAEVYSAFAHENTDQVWCLVVGRWAWNRWRTAIIEVVFSVWTACKRWPSIRIESLCIQGPILRG